MAVSLSFLESGCMRICLHQKAAIHNCILIRVACGDTASDLLYGTFILAVRREGPGGYRLSTRLNVEVFVLRCIRLLYAYLRAAPTCPELR